MTASYSAASRPARVAALALFPRVLVAAMVTGLVVGLVRECGGLPQPRAVMAVALTSAYLVWLLAEAPVTFRSGTQPPAESATLVPYGLARLGTALSAVLIGPAFRPGWPWWPTAFAVLFVGAVGLRLAAIRTLGRFYSHHVVRRDDHAIVTTGPYRIARHPAYAGMLLGHVGFVLFFANPVALLFLAGLAAAVVRRILAEERALWTVPGYPEFARGRARLFPGVW